MKVERWSRSANAVAALYLWLACTASVFGQERSCQADVAKFCSQVEPGGGRVARCLKQSEAQLSGPCRERVKMVGVQLKETLEACQDDLETYCTEVELRDGSIAQCLTRYRNQLSPECITVANLLERK